VDVEKEFSLVLDVSLRTYRGVLLLLCLSISVGINGHAVLTSTPLLPTLPIYVDKLNESRDVYAFIKEVRQAFRDLVLQGR
jgi:kinetochore protein Spc25